MTRTAPATSPQAISASACTPAAAWVNRLRSVRAAVQPYSPRSIETLLDVLNARPRYRGPMEGAAFVTDEAKLRVEGVFTVEELPGFVAWAQETFGVPSHDAEDRAAAAPRLGTYEAHP